MELVLEQAEINQLDEIMKLYKDVIKKTYTTWDEYYPSKELVEEDIKKNNFYVLKTNGKIIAVSFLGEKDADETKEENWTYPLKSAISIARICVSPKYQGQGVGTKFLNMLMTQAKELGADGIHFHVATQNMAACRMYEKSGFKNCGLGQSNYGFDFYKYEIVF